ncbi:efflux RND transporter periplasmic adaptor subunit [Methyloversatilis thermotolerans]|uniref:efflux RND transporter periplasmic adaptor subunit n=1 Tax=Methyloversatilis thermotolerans TaxID=1346290 RepID=UPI0003638848|nr:efflux RND transporter periplasmic adaptor subunit [Methyloversatilis thermotolerans]
MTRPCRDLRQLALPVAITLAIMLSACGARQDDKAQATAKPALTAALISPAIITLSEGITANGGVAAWQEALIGSEVSGLKLVDVAADVGDRVRKGQLLARFDDETVRADLAQARAAQDEAQAALDEAAQNAARARRLQGSDALSAQQQMQYQIAEQTAQARLASARAQVEQQTLRLARTRVTAPDDGIVSARNATLGATGSNGEALFRLVRQGRLEWRAEVTADEMTRLRPGLPVRLQAPGLPEMEGRVRVLAPTVDASTRNALVYVDLPAAFERGLRPGVFARGHIGTGQRTTLAVPLQALSLRDGHRYAFKVMAQDGGLATVSQVRLETGDMQGDLIEVRDGLGMQDRIVAGGATFLADGDRIKVVQP